MARGRLLVGSSPLDIHAYVENRVPEVSRLDPSRPLPAVELLSAYGRSSAERTTRTTSNAIPASSKQTTGRTECVIRSARTRAVTAASSLGSTCPAS